MIFKAIEHKDWNHAYNFVHMEVSDFSEVYSVNVNSRRVYGISDASVEYTFILN